ncbi:peptidyl-tRNA hydrolase [Corynebacterium hindlerae]|uniref:peptidyl-tRNA hydrolase n=1 Tax=Corynebacterium hindlerae TaxID=699041 RepID=UPI003AAE18B5
MLTVLPASLESAHQRLQLVLAPDRDGEDPTNPDTVQAMPIVLHIPKSNRPSRVELLEAAARAVVAVCLDPRAGEDSAFADALQRWYGARIRKIARRARNTQWERVQGLPGVTAEQGGAQARAFVPSAVHATEPLIAKLQIEGTDLPVESPDPVVPGIPLLVVDASLGMSVGKAAAQVGHAAMLLAAHVPADAAWRWAQQGFPLQVREVPRAQFASLAGRADAVAVRDAGYTEVTPGSVTVVALPNEF